MTSILNTEEILDAGEAASHWRAVHVSVADGAGRAERLLLTTVHPWMTAAMVAGAIDDWFLDPAGDDGAELRLRIRGTDHGHLAELRERIEAFLGVRPDDNTVVERAYQPEVDRFGGPHGWAVSAKNLAASTRAAVATIRTAPSHAKRLRAAGELLLASVWATGVDWRGAVEWLRDYACSRAEPTGGRVDVSRARSAAEAAFLRNEAEWLRVLDRVRAVVFEPNTEAGAWHRMQSRTWSALRDLQEAGRLTVPAGTVFRSLVEAAHGRLGLQPADEAQVAWLLSMAVVAPGPREPFFADTVAAVDRQAHEQSKYFPTRLEDQRPDLLGATTAGRRQFRPPRGTVALTRPDGSHPSAPRFEEVLLARRSTYGRYAGPVTLDELSALLYYAAGQTAEKTMPGTDVVLRVRPYPSGGTRYPLRLLLYCHGVSGLPRGTYIYDPAAHALDLLSGGDIAADLQQMSPATDPRVEIPPKVGGKIDATDCPLWIMMVADLTYQRLHYGLRSYRLVLLEGGHLAQNLSLVTTWLGKSCVGLGGFYDDAVNQAVNVDGVNSAVVYVYLVGVVDPPSA